MAPTEQIKTSVVKGEFNVGGGHLASRIPVAPEQARNGYRGRNTSFLKLSVNDGNLERGGRARTLLTQAMLPVRGHALMR